MRADCSHSPTVTALPPLQRRVVTAERCSVLNRWVLIGVTVLHLALLVALAGRAEPPVHHTPVPALTGLLISALPENVSQLEPVVAQPRRWVQSPRRSQEIEPTVISSPATVEFSDVPTDTVDAVAAQHVHGDEPAMPTPAVAAPAQTPLETTVLPRTDASQLNHPAAYPAVSRRLHEHGVVLLEVLVLSDGSVGEVRLKQSSGYARLDTAALDAVKHWRYLAARRGGQPLSAWYLQPVTFSLDP